MPPRETSIPVYLRRVSLLILLGCLTEVGLGQSGPNPGTYVADFRPNFHLGNVELPLAVHIDSVEPDPAGLLRPSRLPTLRRRPQPSWISIRSAMELPPPTNPSENRWGRQEEPQFQIVSASNSGRQQNDTPTNRPEYLDRG